MRLKYLAGFAILCVALAALARCASPSSRSRPEGSVLLTGRLVVRVTDRDSRPIPGARVSVTGPKGSVRASATTAEDGTAEFPALRAGAYSVAARAVGARAPRRTNVRIRGGGETSLYLMLEPADVDTIQVRGKSPG